MQNYNLLESIQNPLGGELKAGEYHPSVFQHLKLDTVSLIKKGKIEVQKPEYDWEIFMYSAKPLFVEGMKHYRASQVNVCIEQLCSVFREDYDRLKADFDELARENDELKK